MHQIRFPLGLCPRLRWGSLQHSSKPLAVFKGPTSKGREGIEGQEGKERGRDLPDQCQTTSYVRESARQQNSTPTTHRGAITTASNASSSGTY